MNKIEQVSCDDHQMSVAVRVGYSRSQCLGMGVATKVPCGVGAQGTYHMADACENIIFPELLLRVVKKYMSFLTN